MDLPDWQLGQDNEAKFVLVNGTGTEVAGLAGTFSVEINPPGDVAFKPAIGTKSELGNGFYRYISPASEVAQTGIVALTITGPGIIQQNLAYQVKSPTPNLHLFPYLVTDVASGNPLQGTRVEVSTDIARSNVIWVGYTDAFGYAKDTNGDDPFLPVGTLYFWRYMTGYLFNNPDTELVSAP